MDAFQLISLSLLLCVSSVYTETRKDSCEEIQIVNRRGWRARPPWKTWDMNMPVNHVVICHTVSPTCSNRFACARRVSQVQDYHMDDKGWWDIGYGFIIAGDGRIYEGRGWNRTGAFSVAFNANSIGVAFLGDYTTQKPSQRMLNASKKLIDCGLQLGYLAPSLKIHGARDVSCTESPGDALYKIIRKWKRFVGGRVPGYYCRN